MTSRRRRPFVQRRGWSIDAAIVFMKAERSRARMGWTSQDRVENRQENDTGELHLGLTMVWFQKSNWSRYSDRVAYLYHRRLKAQALVHNTCGSYGQP